MLHSKPHPCMYCIFLKQHKLNPCTKRSLYVRDAYFFLVTCVTAWQHLNLYCGLAVSVCTTGLRALPLKILFTKNKCKNLLKFLPFRSSKLFFNSSKLLFPIEVLKNSEEKSSNIRSKSDPWPPRPAWPFFKVGPFDPIRPENSRDSM